MGMVEDLQKLRELHAAGGLSDDEFERAKAAVIGGPAPQAPFSPAAPPPLRAQAPPYQPASGPGEAPSPGVRKRMHERQTISFIIVLAGCLVIPFALSWGGSPPIFLVVLGPLLLLQGVLGLCKVSWVWKWSPWDVDKDALYDR